MVSLECEARINYIRFLHLRHDCSDYAQLSGLHQPLPSCQFYRILWILNAESEIYSFGSEAMKSVWA